MKRAMSQFMDSLANTHNGALRDQLGSFRDAVSFLRTQHLTHCEAIRASTAVEIKVHRV